MTIVHLEATYTNAATTATTTEVTFRQVGGGATTQTASNRLIIIAADMECGAAGDHHLFIAPTASDATPSAHVSVCRTLTGSTTVASFAGVTYRALADDDKLYVKTPATSSVQIRAFGYTAEF